MGTVAQLIIAAIVGPAGLSAKTPWITNTTHQTLPKGHKINWNSSDGDKGVIELDSALKPGDSVKGLGNPGQSYTCTAWMAK